MNQAEFKPRTKGVALRVIALSGEIPRSHAGDVIARQLIRSATSVGANYRAACRARSPQEMFAKLSVVEEEADESLYWLELLEESRLVQAEHPADVRREMSEIVAMVVQSKKTLRSRLARRLDGNQQSTIVNRQSIVGSPR
ncbi:MAG: four helix bundle protein [Hyphomicrobiales bacterium]